MVRPSAAPKPTPAQKAWMKLGYGMFVHFGPNTFTQSGWGDGRFPPADFAPRRLDTGQWAAMAAEAGMKYVVLTAKHHDGFCLWPSRHTEYCTRGSPGRPDVVGRFVEGFRKAGLRTGLYYSLWDRNFPRYEDDAAYSDYMFAQIEELLTNYGPILELWFDGGWDKDHPTRASGRTIPRGRRAPRRDSRAERAGAGANSTPTSTGFSPIASSSRTRRATGRAR